MEHFGHYRPLAPPAQWLGFAAFIGVLFLTALLERLQFQLRAAEGSRWWASNGRDVVNAFAVGAMGLALRLLGFAGPIALCVAATLVLALNLLQGAWAAHPRRSTAISLGVCLLLGAPIILVPATVHRLFRAALELLF